jgi:ankyrin repeat protein
VHVSPVWPQKRPRILTVVLAAALVAVPGAASAQFSSQSHDFLDHVRKKEGREVTDALAKPGTTIINTQDITTGESALHSAAARKDALWISFLLGKGADPNLRDAKGQTPLVVASDLGFVEGVDLMIQNGARVEEVNTTGETPLIAAVHRRDVPMMRLLLKAGASPDRADSSGRSARDYAKVDRSSTMLLAEIDAAAKNKRGNGGPSYGPTL